ncbi:MAG: molybdopterin-guanine dinucleotide biosynthesis protein MobC [Thermodesulfobacteriota bacterium]|nr:MAG: molybdopterin-guanine dinucleotide biosynthesis protein MobC [Thermodesulfobacteriota bacterium]
MQMKTAIHYQLGLPESCRIRAAELYEEAFRQKFAPIVKSRKKLIEILTDCIKPEFAVVALKEERLVGLAGFHNRGSSFTGGGSASSIIKKLGLFKGLWAIALFTILYERKESQDELLIDGIVVDPSMRGQGIGTRMLETLFKYATNEGFDSIRLDVVDTNPDARRLYESQGFVATKTDHHPYLKPFLGFSSSTTMVKNQLKKTESSLFL